MRGALSTILILICISCPLANASINDAVNQQAGINEIVTLPIKGVQAIHTDGKIVYLSDNGRFVFTGQIYDLWSKQPLMSMEKIREATERVYLKGMGIDVNKLNTLSLGTGEKEVVIFVDPRCSFCHQLMSEAKEHLTNYTFKFVVVPILGGDSYKQARTIYCANDKNEALKALAANTVNSIQVKQNCDLSQYEQSVQISKLIGIDSVPFIVANDGRVKRGLLKNLMLWLEN